MSFIDITPLMIDNNTIGTTINLSKFKNIVPKGKIYLFAISTCPIIRSPAITPKINAVTIINGSDIFFISFI